MPAMAPIAARRLLLLRYTMAQQRRRAIPSPAADIRFSALAFLEHPQIQQIRQQSLRNRDLCALRSSKFILITKTHNI
jgi:hypothetical protein